MAELAPAEITMITIEVDNREKYPLLFPATVQVTDPITRKSTLKDVRTVKVHLPAGDYRLADHPTACIIERKGSQRELFNNFFTSDNKRQGRAFQKLKKACRYPVIFIEESPLRLFCPTLQIKEPEKMVSLLTYYLACLDIPVIWMSQGQASTRRRKMGAFILHTLLGYATRETIEKKRDET